MRYWYFHPHTETLLDVYNGRSVWEDHADKANFILLKEVGPALDHCEEPLKAYINGREFIIDECVKALGGRYGAAATKDLQSLKNRK